MYLALPHAVLKMARALQLRDSVGFSPNFHNRGCERNLSARAKAVNDFAPIIFTERYSHQILCISLGLMSKKVVVYLNPNAAGFQRKIVRQLQVELDSPKFEVKFKEPQNTRQLIKEVRKDVAAKVDFIIAVGGDGTVNTLVQALVGTSTRLVLIPCGTANDFAKTLGIDSSLKHIRFAMERDQFCKVDLIRVNKTFMCTNGGIGCAYDISQKINLYRLEKRFFKSVMKGLGANIYPLLFTKEMLFEELKSYELFLESAHLPFLNPRIKTPLILINNQSVLGGRFHVAPSTLNNDGQFNVTIFLHSNKAQLIQCAYQLMTGRYPNHDRNLISFETDKLVINNLSSNRLSFFGDGESLVDAKIIEIEIKPQALNVCLTPIEVDPSDYQQQQNAIALENSYL